MDPVRKIGESAPQFELYDLHGNLHRVEDLTGQIAVFNFWSAECDWCKRVDGEVLAHLKQWKNQVQVWWIASNANEPRDMIERTAAEMQLPTLLIDGDQVAAGLYGAQTTPHFFVLDTKGKLQYQGAWDDITFRQRTATRLYVPEAVEALINRKVPDPAQTPPYGCTLVRFTDHPG
jgi:peroxiredoxin